MLFPLRGMVTTYHRYTEPSGDSKRLCEFIVFLGVNVYLTVPDGTDMKSMARGFSMNQDSPSSGHPGRRTVTLLVNPNVAVITENSVLWTPEHGPADLKGQRQAAQGF